MAAEYTKASQDIWLERTNDLVIDVPKAAALLGISKSTAYDAVRRGEIPSLRLGRRIVVPVPKLRLMLGVPNLEGAAPPPNLDLRQ